MNRKIFARMTFKLKAFTCLALVGGMVLVGCDETTETDSTLVGANDSIESNNVPTGINVGGKFFSVPSPVETAMMLQNSGASYDPAVLNSADNASNYSTKFRKAINLGIYGADLGYVTLYDNTEDAVGYLNSVVRLSEDLNLAGAFDKELMERFKNNLGQKDSMLTLVADAYRSGDNYLKNNDRDEVASLILAGGWIESLFFAVNVARENGDQEVIDRIGEQKTSLQNLISLLEMNSDDESSDEVEELITDLSNLSYLFDEIESNYTFAESEHKPEEKRTVLKGTTNVTVTDEQLNAISAEVESIRNRIVG